MEIKLNSTNNILDNLLLRSQKATIQKKADKKFIIEFDKGTSSLFDEIHELVLVSEAKSKLSKSHGQSTHVEEFERLLEKR